jgi:hypothetical protein
LPNLAAIADQDGIIVAFDVRPQCSISASFRPLPGLVRCI